MWLVWFWRCYRGVSYILSLFWISLLSCRFGQCFENYASIHRIASHLIWNQHVHQLLLLARWLGKTGWLIKWNWMSERKAQCVALIHKYRACHTLIKRLCILPDRNSGVCVHFFFSLSLYAVHYSFNQFTHMVLKQWHIVVGWLVH